jgi:spore germination protein YaaH
MQVMKHQSLSIVSLAVLGALVSPLFAFAQSTDCVTFSADLSFGSTGTQVTKLQTFLKAQGYLTAPLVPNFGNATLTAVRAFQGAQGISATGTVGPLTRAAIQRVSCGGASSSSNSGASSPTNNTSNKFEVTGWIPYWRAATGTQDVLPHLDELTEVNPFVYSMKNDGTILDNAPMDQEPWPSFIAAAKAKKVRVIPTIMWGNGDAEHAILSSATLRQALETRITALVKNNGYDGIDIDFEGKHAEDKNYFSTFLKGLYQRMGSKWVTCSIESRTPVDARYYGAEIPPDATVYANDFTAINKYCDRVKVMAYDQQGIDQELASAAASSSEIYAPVADPFWVRKVIDLMSKSISKNKMLIGVPTYGYEYDVTAYSGNQYTYDILWTFNPGYATPIAQQYNITPVRNAAGEMQFTYFASGTTQPSANVVAPISLNSIPSALLAAAASSAYADSVNSHQSFRLMDWPDAVSIAGKAELAADLGLRGISIFKLDGGEAPGMWGVLVGVKQ